MIKVVFSLFIFLFFIIYFLLIPREKTVKLNYIITNTGISNSFDPLDADKTVNLTEMRMLYATPIEISKNNTLISNVLESFNYNPETHILTFVVKTGIKYSDESLITPKDVALSITRMAHSRPNFPVIKDILGINDWIKTNNPLTTFPEGIKLEQQKIKIHLTKPHLNPLFRFCLELFSIIPERCIDLSTGKMNCERAPSSGYYVIESLTKEKIIFQKRKNLAITAEEIPYNEITFSFEKLQDSCNKKITENTIIVGSETDFIANKCASKLSENQIHWTPAAKFNALLFNPNVPPFDTATNRKFFAKRVREYIKTNYPTLAVEESLFSPLIPGYLSSDNFPNPEDKNSFLNFKHKKITLIKNSSTLTKDAIEAVAKSLEMDIEYLHNPSDDLLDQSFLNGKLQVDSSSSGFWAQDPVGDLSMYFTPQLHITLNFLWKDKTLYQLLKSIENETSSTEIRIKMEQINMHLFNNSLIAPIVHFRKIFITSDSIQSLNLPQAVTSPAPWQLLPLK